MLFNSLSFAVFLPIVFVLYWFVANSQLRLQNILLLAASFFFYACWDFRFLFLLLFSILLDYFTGIQMHNAARLSVKKFWFWLSISVNLGFLAAFKYYNFFVESLASGLAQFGVSAQFSTLQIILPVGISFYTFHGLSYVIDIYKGKITPEKNFVDYAVFVSFFPLLVAGPIERATHLLPQIQRKREFDYHQAVDGLRQILWGLFKKLVIADNCAAYANEVFNHSPIYSGSTHLVGAIFFTLQIYGDFSGYSDIALGTARLFGIELLRNFSFPFFSRDIPEFWRRWHISLSSWFKDYLYIPLGGSSGGVWMKIRNTFIIFLVSGFWHGANWTFIVWGLLNALYILPYIVWQTNRNHLEIVAKGKRFANAKETLQIIGTFGLTVLAFTFFRANTVTDAVHYLQRLFSSSLFTKPEGIHNELIWFIVAFISIEWIGRENKYAIEKLGLHWPQPLRISFYYAILLVTFMFAGLAQNFIYFQF